MQWNQNWQELAQRANWSAAALAKECGVSLRTLERYFLKAMGERPQAWLCEERQRRAVELLRDGSNVKTTAALLGYRHATHFSREFKKHWGHAPTERGHDPVNNNTVNAGNGTECRNLV
jgi:transcriptional regulator GlxA family with amidase domain